MSEHYLRSGLSPEVQKEINREASRILANPPQPPPRPKDVPVPKNTPVWRTGASGCPRCSGPLKRKWLFLHSDKCISPKCDNYFGKTKPMGEEGEKL